MPNICARNVVCLLVPLMAAGAAVAKRKVERDLETLGCAARWDVAPVTTATP